MSKKKGVTKSHSVNDVPVGMRPSQMLEALEEGHFEELLGRLATPSYTRKSEGCLTMSNLDEQKEMKLNWMENNLREKDNEEQRQMRDEKKRRKDGTPFDSRNPPSTSPPGSPQHSNANLARSSYYSYVTDDRKFDYIDAGGDGPEDVEMADLSKTCEIKAEVKTPIVYTKGNVEETVQEWPDWNVKQPEVPFMGTSSLEDPNKVDQKLRDDLDDDDDDIAGRSLRSRHLGDLNSLMGNKQERPYGDSQYTRLDTYSGTLHSTDRLEESKFLQSKKRVEKKKQKANKGVRTVGESGSEFPGSVTPIEELVASIEGNQSEDVQQQDRRRRQNNAKKDKAAATIGNHNGKAPAAAQSNKSQNPTTTGSMNKDKKSPNKKNKKGATNDSTTPAAAEALNPTSEVAQPAAPAKRTSTEDAEEEYLSADEGVASTVTSTPSDVMIDGANYRADSDDVSNLDKEVNNEAEFVTVTAKKKSSMSQNQNQRNGSTGKVERRGPPQPQQPRRNSMEDPRLNKMPPARHHPQPQNISLGDYLNEKKPETHTKVKMVPFKESKKKHERLESTADSDYMDANEEMVLPIANTNESVTPERGFSYADAAKKSAEQSRENSPACANLPSGTPGVSPSPPPAQRLESAAPEVTSSTIPSKSIDDSSSPAAPVLSPENAGKSADSTGLSFFYDESAGANNAEGDNQSADSPAPTNNPFVLAVNGKTIQFARGMAVDAKPVDENHRALADIMLKRWNAFVNEGPAPIYYEPPVQV